MSKLQGISPKLPLVYDSTDGPYQLNKTLGQVIKQNLKMLILTVPGERIMIPDFGVGLQRYLFESVSEDVFSEISQKINEQVNFYMPTVNLEEILFLTSDDDNSLSINDVRISVRYNISPFNQSDELSITSTMTN